VYVCVCWLLIPTYLHLISNVLIGFTAAVLVGLERADYTVAEEGGTALICFSLSGVLERTITFIVTTMDGTASGELSFL